MMRLIPEEINDLAEWCTKNNLLLNVSKTTEPIIDFRKKEMKTHTPVNISGAKVEQVNSFRFLGISITENLPWTTNLSTLVKKAQKQQYFLRKLSEFPCQVLVNFYGGAIESILTGLCTDQGRRVLVTLLPPDKRYRSIHGRLLNSCSSLQHKIFFPYLA